MQTKYAWVLVAMIGLAGCTGSKTPGSVTGSGSSISVGNASTNEPSPPGADAGQGSSAPSAHREGNGGDHVRATFLLMGSAVIQHLRHTGNGQAVMSSWSLDINTLDQTLSVHRIRVSSRDLKDNGHSEVDALGSLHLITLVKTIWMEHFEKERDVYYLVFHEMLRSAGYQDDDYVISKALMPFPVRERISTRVTPVHPLISEEQLSPIVLTDKLIFGGSGCPSGHSFYADFDKEKNIMEFSSTSFGVSSSRASQQLTSRRNCDLSIPLDVPKGYRVTVTQIDISARLSLPENATGSVRAETFVAGGVARKVISNHYRGGRTGLGGRSILRQNPRFSTPCGGSFLFRVSVSAEVATEGSSRALIAVDRVAAYLSLDKCGLDDDTLYGRKEF